MFGIATFPRIGISMRCISSAQGDEFKYYADSILMSSEGGRVWPQLLAPWLCCVVVVVSLLTQSLQASISKSSLSARDGGRSAQMACGSFEQDLHVDVPRRRETDLQTVPDRVVRSASKGHRHVNR